MDYQGETFLNRLYKDLHLTDEVMHTASPSDTKDEKTRKYLNRLEKMESLALNSNYNGMDLLKNLYYAKYVVKKENIPVSYYETQKKIALERGYGHIEIDDEMKEKMSSSIIEEQKKSLDLWLDYLISKENAYPEWYKYYVFQGMIRLGTYDKEKDVYNKRTETTVNTFAELNREALALIYDSLVKVFKGHEIDDKTLEKMIKNGSFSKIYSYVLKKICQAYKYTKNNTGIWIKYDQGSDPKPLVDSLQGRGTGWCTAGYETAKTQLEVGDFYVYYTKDSNGEYKQPRIAIRMENGKIGEIRGIAEHQNLESEMKDALEEKLKEFSDKDKYSKKVNDMETLTKIYNEYKNRELEIDELKFLYEIDNKIEGFGYFRDPRINEILEGRNYKEDLSKVFNCSHDNISNNEKDVLHGKKILCFYGNLRLGKLTNIDDLVLPEIICGDLELDGLITAEKLILPRKITGYLDLKHLKKVSNLVLPENVGGYVDLQTLKTVDYVILPQNIGGGLYLDSLEKADSLIFPENVGGNVSMIILEEAYSLVFPKNIGQNLILPNLMTTNGLVLPESVGGNIYLNSLEKADSLIFPENVGGGVLMSRLKEAHDLVFPVKIGNSLTINSLEKVSNVVLPKIIGGYLNMSSLKTTDGLIVPENFEYKDTSHLAGISIDALVAKSLIGKVNENNKTK